MAAPANVRKKTSEMVSEGYDPRVAYAASWNMKRRGKLSRGGKYRRVHKKKRGPIGRMRRASA